MKLTVNLGEHSYPIYIENHISEHTASYIKEVFQGKKIMIVSDDSVYPLYGERILSSLNKDFDCYHFILPHGEETKSFDNLPRIYKAPCMTFAVTFKDLIPLAADSVVFCSVYSKS